MTILVTPATPATGATQATGTVGRHIVRHLLERGRPVRRPASLCVAIFVPKVHL
jgi:nucleoside-diphosphate-sugar epimerase